MAKSTGKPSNIEYRLMAGLLGAAATFATQRLLRAGWKTITGSEPPDVRDPDVPIGAAISWLVASGVGLGVAQLLVQRFAARRWALPTRQDLSTQG